MTTRAVKPTTAAPRNTRVSAIIPVHNGGAYIEAALGSVLAQQRPVSEIIIIDDGSTDNSMELAQRVTASAGIPTIVLSTSGVGQSAARNAGAAAATGDYVAFLDQDDEWLTHHVAKLAGVLDERPFSNMVYADINTMDASGGLLLMNLNAHAGNEHPKTSVGDIVFGDIMALPSATIVRRHALLELGGFDESLQGYEDDDLYFRGFRAGWRPQFVPEATANYRVHGAGNSLSPTFRTSRLRFAAKVAETIPDNPRLRAFYVRDFLLPRMRRSFMADYATAMTMDDLATARSIARDFRELYAGHGAAGFKVNAGLWLLEHPRIARGVLRVRPRVFGRGSIPEELRFRR